MGDLPHIGPTGLDLDAVGRVSKPHRARWGEQEVRLYALAVGASQESATSELDFTADATLVRPQRVLPTYAIVLAMSAQLPAIGKVDLRRVLHAEQALTLHQAISICGESESVTEVTSILDKGSGALVRLKTNLRLVGSDERIATVENGLFIRGAGGWGGGNADVEEWARPTSSPDCVVEYLTSPNQALLYRIASGDANPLHSEPAAAAAVGFANPILHGLCTFGFAGRALLHTLCDGRPERFGIMKARFSSPVVPGDRLTVSIWTGVAGSAKFITSTSSGTVLDRGQFGAAP